MSMRQEDLAKKQRFERLKVTFEEVKTMQMMGYDLDEMISALKLHPDYLYFVNQYITVHAGENFEEVIHKAYALLYSEEIPMKLKEEVKSEIKPKEPENGGLTMEHICTRQLIKNLLYSRVEFVMCKLMNKDFNARDFAACGYDRIYISTMLHVIRLYCPGEITRETIQDEKTMRKMVNRIYEELYIINTKRKKMYSCDRLDFEGLKTFMGRY